MELELLKIEVICAFGRSGATQRSSRTS